jgi:hypothetical protein
MSIYPTRICYTYLIGWSKLNTWYYGAKYGKDANPDKFWVDYFTSSKSVSKYVLLHGSPDIIEIRKTFNDIEKCQLWEMRVLKRMKSIGRLNIFLNKKIPTGKWINSNIHRNNIDYKVMGENYKMATLLKNLKKCNFLNIDDAKSKLEHLIDCYTNIEHIVKFSGITRCNLAKLFPYILEDEYSKISLILNYHIKEPKIKKTNKGSAPAMTIDGISLGRITLTDPRWSTKEIVSVNLERIFTDTHKENIKLNHHDCIAENNSFYGKTHSIETKIKISARDYSSTSKAVVVNGVLYRSEGEANRELGIPRGIITRLINSGKASIKYNIVTASYKINDAQY